MASRQMHVPGYVLVDCLRYRLQSLVLLVGLSFLSPDYADANVVLVARLSMSLQEKFGASRH